MRCIGNGRRRTAALSIQPHEFACAENSQGSRHRALHRLEGLVQIFQDVVDMLGADGKADSALGDARVRELFIGQLRMGGGCGMDDQGFHVCHVRQQREDLQVVDEPERLFPATLDLEGEDGGPAVREVLLIQVVVGMVGQAGMVHLGDFGMVHQVIHHLLGVFAMALQSQGQGLGSLKEQECRER